MPYIRFVFRRPDVGRYKPSSITDIIEQQLTPKGNFSKFILERMQTALASGLRVELETVPEGAYDGQTGAESNREGAD